MLGAPLAGMPVARPAIRRPTRGYQHDERRATPRHAFSPSLSMPLSMRRLTTLALLVLATPLATTPLAAQGRWQTVGHTGDGNPVQLDSRSVKRRGSTVDATVRVPFIKPKKMPGGNVTSSVTKVTFDCAKETVAIKEYTYFFDEKANKVFQHQAARTPGFAPVMGGSMTKVAYDELCRKKNP